MCFQHGNTISFIKQTFLLCFFNNIVDDESDGEEDGVTVINVVEAHGLQET